MAGGRPLLQRSRILVTDAAPFMIKAGNGLQVLCPRMIHVTCVDHAMHRVAEELRLEFPKSDSLVSSTKKALCHRSPS